MTGDLPAHPPRPRLLVLLGQTGTGKSRLALDVAEAIDGEIVGCDAIQVYRGLDIASAKPTEEERRRVPHHLVDHVDPVRDYSLAAYVEDAQQAISGIDRRGRVPIVVGGTGMYLRGLLCGILSVPGRNPAIRVRLRSIAARGGTARLHRLLQRHDPRAAGRIAPTDTQRLVRALELAAGEGTNWSQRIARQGTWSEPVAERYPSLKIGLSADREWLVPRIDRRVVEFFDDGLVEEVRGLLRRGIPRQANALKAIGYAQVLAAIDAGVDPLQVVEQVQQGTRRYSKRQRTWFRKEPNVTWIDAATDPASLTRRVLRLWSAPESPDLA